MVISVCDRLENIVGKGENGDYQQFLPFITMFSIVVYFTVVISSQTV